MDAFTLRAGVMHAEDVPLPAIAEAVGTPVYVYSRAKLAAKSLQPSSDTQPLGERAGPDMRLRTRILARALAAGTPKAQ